MTTFRTTARRGALLAEVVISVVLLGALITTAASLQSSSARANRNVLLRLRCIAAAQAALDSLTATGEPLAEADVARLWPGLRVEVRTEAGKGDWAGLTLATAAAHADDGGRKVSVELRRYVDTNTAVPSASSAAAGREAP
jgi:Tfp pilus assembly protein PilV